MMFFVFIESKFAGGLGLFGRIPPTKPQSMRAK